MTHCKSCPQSSGHHRRRHCPGHKLARLIELAALAALAAALIEELRKPAEERSWHGELGGLVPYDFRKPTAERVAERLWNSEGPMVSPATFGVGWDPNVGRIVSEVKKALP